MAESLRREIDRLVRDRPGGAAATSGTTTTQAASAAAAPPIPPGTELGTPSAPGAAAVNGTAAGSDPGSGSGSGRSVPTPVDEADLTMAGTLGSRPAAVPPGPKDGIGTGTGAVARPSASISAATGGLTVMVRSPLVRRMLETVLADPILLSAEERYLSGHYLAYLLSGSRREGLFMRRPMEPRNADRAPAAPGQ